MRSYSLAYLTSTPLPVLDCIALAARLGYDSVGLRALPTLPGGDFQPLLEQPPLVRTVRQLLRDIGLTVSDMEVVRLGPAYDAARFEAFLDLCGELGARAVLVAGDDPDEARLTASFAAFCERAAPYGLTANLEFMPWTAVKDCRTAARIVQNAGQANGGILVDTLHAARSTTTLADVAAIPRHMLHYAQIADAPVAVPTTTEGLIHTARQDRLLPGDGGIDLAAWFGVLPANIPVSIEIPSETGKAAGGVEAWARRALEKSKAVLGDG